MAKIITVANQKGGVGKSTTVLNLGLGLVERGKKVLLVDLDEQANLSGSFSEEVIAQAEEKNLHIGRILVGEKSFDEVVCKISDKLHLLPSAENLGTYQDQIFGKMNREWILKKVLQKYFDLYDYVIFDTPPNKGVMTNNALFASTSFLVPVQPESYSYDGLSKLIRHVNEISSFNGIDLGGVVLTQYHPNQKGALMQAIAKEVLADPGLKPFRTYLRKNKLVHEAQHLKQNLYSYASNTTATEDFLNFTDEVIARYE